MTPTLPPAWQSTPTSCWFLRWMQGFPRSAPGTSWMRGVTFSHGHLFSLGVETAAQVLGGCARYVLLRHTGHVQIRVPVQAHGGGRAQEGEEWTEGGGSGSLESHHARFYNQSRFSVLLGWWLLVSFKTGAGPVAWVESSRYSDSRRLPLDFVYQDQ